MLIPQGMAYSILAGMPPMYGLYSSIISLLLYAPFSTSPQLAVGPVAMMSLLSNAAVSVFDGASCEGGDGTPECARFIDLSQKLAFMVGVFSLLLGLLKAGYLVNFLSHPVLKGFTMAAALVIGSSQLSKVLGFKIPRHEYVYDTWVDAVIGIGEGKVHGLTFGLFVENMALFYLLKYARTFLRSHPAVKTNKIVMQIVNAFPSALVVVIVNIVIVSAAGLDQQGVGIVGKIDSGIPSPVNVLNSTFLDDAAKLAVSALVMCVVGFMESISVAKAMALRFGNVVESDQELVGLGLANTVGSFFNAFATTGGFSRTSVNADAGAKTPVSGIVSAVILVIVVVFLTGLFEYLPSVTLGSMIIFAVTKLFEFTTPRMLWAVDKGDFVVYLVTFIATIVLGIEIGIAVGAVISLARVIKEAAVPHVAELGKMPGTAGTWRNIKRFPGKAETEKDLRVMRFDSPLFFANAAFFKDLILRTSKPTPGPDGCAPRAIVVDFSAVVTMDSSAIHMLEGLPDELRKQAKQLKHDRVKALRKRLSACAAVGDDVLSDITRLSTPRSASVDEYHPAKSFAAVPCSDEDVADEPKALAERIRLVVTNAPRIPVLYIACVRGPVRDLIRRNEFFEDCDEARAKFVKGNFWRCEHPCRCVAPHSLLFVGCRRVPGMPLPGAVALHDAPHGEEILPSLAGAEAASATAGAAGKGDAAPTGGEEALRSTAAEATPGTAGKGAKDEIASARLSLHGSAVDGAGSADEMAKHVPVMRARVSVREDDTAGELAEGPVASVSGGAKYPLLQMVMQEQDIDDAVAKVKSLLSEFDDEAASVRAVDAV